MASDEANVSVAGPPGTRVQWLHRLPREGPYSRGRFLVEQARGQRVVHVGFADAPLLAARIRSRTWLHALLADAAAEIVGIDLDAEAVAWARAQGFDVRLVDVERPGWADGLSRSDVIIAADVIEHLESPGLFLRGCKDLAPRLVVTTPNALRPLNYAVSATGRELIHPEHVCVHTPRTLAVLLERTGWRVDQLAFYRSPAETAPWRDVCAQAGNVLRRVAGTRLTPWWADGLIAVAHEYR